MGKERQTRRVNVTRGKTIELSDLARWENELLRAKEPICTWRPPANRKIAAVCPACHHSVMLHPSVANPDLKACLVCELLDQKKQLVKTQKQIKRSLRKARRDRA